MLISDSFPTAARSEEPDGSFSERQASAHQRLVRQQSQLLATLCRLLSHLLRDLLWTQLREAERQSLFPLLRTLEHEVSLARLIVQPTKTSQDTAKATAAQESAAS